MNARTTKRPPRMADGYTATVTSRQPPSHKDVTPSQGAKVIERPYTPPAGLSEQQQALVDECTFLTEDKINVLKAKLLGGIQDLFGFTTEEQRAVKVHAGRRNISL